MAGIALHGNSAEQPGIPECWQLKKKFDKCQAGGLPPPGGRRWDVEECSLTEEMDLATLSTSRNGPGVSAGSSEEDPVAKSAREREERLRSLSRETMSRVHFCNSCLRPTR